MKIKFTNGMPRTVASARKWFIQASKDYADRPNTDEYFILNRAALNLSDVATKQAAREFFKDTSGGSTPG